MKLLKSQKGDLTLIIIIVVAVLAIGGGAAFLYAKKTGASLPGPLAGVTLNPNCEQKDPNLCKFLNNFSVQSSYKIQSTSGTGADKTDFTVEISGQDKSHTITSTGGKENYNVITIADTTYTKDYTDNKWYKQVASKDTDKVKDEVAFKPDSQSSNQQDQAPKQTYKAAGKEACGSLQCFKYQVITPGSDSSEYIWFDDKKYLLRKTSSTSGGQTFEATYSYDKVNISAPSPVKDTPPAATAPVIDAASMKAAQDAAAAAAQNAATDSSQSDTSQ